MRTGWPKVDILQAVGRPQWGACPHPARNPGRAEAPQPAPMSSCSWPAPPLCARLQWAGGKAGPNLSNRGLWALPRPRAGSPGSSISPREERGEGRRGEGEGEGREGELSGMAALRLTPGGSALFRDQEDSALYQAPGSLGKAAPPKKAAPESHRLHGALPGRPLGSLCTHAQACLPSQTTPRDPRAALLLNWLQATNPSSWLGVQDPTKEQFLEGSLQCT